MEKHVIEIHYTPALDAELRMILKEHRHKEDYDTSTPELLHSAVRHERAVEDETLRRIVGALARRQAPALDCGIIAAFARLADQQKEVA